MLSVLIPARDEKYLKPTIESTLAAARGEIEIIAVLDGYWPEPPISDDPRVTLIHNMEAIGQRPAVNQAARVAKGKYILKTDGHSMFDEGFDVKLAADCEYDWTVIPRMYNLDVEKWQPKTQKKTDFMWINSPENGLQDKPFRSLYYDGKMARKYPECYNAYKKNPIFQGDICDTMSAIGACWFMHKDRFWELEGMDEAHGHWGQVGVEVALKAWLSGGRHVVNKKTWFAHYFRGHVGFPWPASGRQHEAARKYSREFWMSNKWHLQAPGRDIYWLVKKFAPLPNWKDNGKAKLISVPAKEERKPEIPLKVETGQKVVTDLTLLYYTANTSVFREAIEKRLEKQVYPIISISQEPIALGTNICVGKIGRSLENIYRQVLEGAKKATTKYVALVEDDCLYVPEHFEHRPTGDCFAYNLSRWLLHPSGVYSYRKRPVLSQCIAPRELLIECLEERFKLPKIPKKYCGEVGLFEKKLGIKEFPYETFETKDPNVVLCHDKDTSGRKYYGKDAEWRGDLYPWGGGNVLRFSLASTEEVMPKGKEAIIKYGRSGKIHSQHSLISSAIFDVEKLCKHRMDFCDRRKPAQLQRFLDCFPPFLDEVVAREGKVTDEEFVANPIFKPYYDYMVDHLNPVDRKPKLTGKGQRHVFHQLREVYTLYVDIRDNGLKAPLDIWRSGKDQSIMTLHRGGRRLEILKKLGAKSVSARTFKSKQIFRAHNPHRDWSLGPVKKDSIHNLAIDQFTRLGHRATDKYWVHNYTRLYDRYLSQLRDKPIKLLEIGVFRGASLLLWKDAFPKAQIYGIDKNTRMWKAYVKGQKRIKVFVGLQEDNKFLNEQVIPAGPFDVIIDDGGHHPDQQLATFKALWPHIAEGGFYILEDLQGNYWKRYAPDGPLMMEEIKSKVDEICQCNDPLLQIRSMCLHYNFCVFEKIF